MPTPTKPVVKTDEQAVAELQATIDAAVKTATEKAAADAVAKFTADLASLASAPEPSDDPYEGLDPAVVKHLKARDAQHDAEVAKAKADADQVRKELDEVREAEANRLFKSKAEELPCIGAPDEVSKVLKSVAAGDPAAYAAVETLLKAANDRLAESGLLKPSGTAGEGWLSPGSTDDAPQSALDTKTKALMDADPKLTYADAVSKAVAENPSLYAELRKSFRAVGNS